MKAVRKIIVALDVEKIDKAEEIVDKLKKYVDVFKIGPVLYTKYGNQTIELVNMKGKEVFLDLKFCDIPSVVAKSVEGLLKYNLFMMSFHCLGGKEMLSKVRDVVDTYKFEGVRKPYLLGVSILTSLDEADLKEFGFKYKVKSVVGKLAKLAFDCNFDGIICSWNEVEDIKKTFGEKFIVVTPGVGSEHKRSIKMKAGKFLPDFIVVGRRVIESTSPVKEIKKIYADFGMG